MFVLKCWQQGAREGSDSKIPVGQSPELPLTPGYESEWAAPGARCRGRGVCPQDGWEEGEGPVLAEVVNTPPPQPGTTRKERAAWWGWLGSI